MKGLKILGGFILLILAFAGITQRNVPGGENNIYLGIVCLILAILLLFSLVRKKKFNSSQTNPYLPQQNISANLNVNTTTNITENIHTTDPGHLHSIENDSFLELPKDVLSLLYIKGGIFSNYKDSLEMEPSLIDLSLPIDTTTINEEDSERDIGYYPSYSGLSPKERYIYLKWLQNVDDTIPIGYVFIFYYGLERQLLYGKYNQAFRMVIRLQKHHNNGSFIAYSTDALLIATLKRKKYNMLQEISTSESGGKICILINFINGKPITAEQLIAIRNSVGFTNNRYLKLCPELFIDILNQKLIEHYNSHFYPVTKEDFINSTEKCTLALANYSLGSQKRFAEAPDITSNSSFSESVYKLLSETHEEVKQLRRKQKTKSELTS